MTFTPDGTHRTNLLKGRHFLLGSDPQWSPDGSRLLFVAGRLATDHVWAVRPNGRNLIRLG
jgi:Tol biopolymer transport system component